MSRKDGGTDPIIYNICFKKFGVNFNYVDI